MPHVKLWGEYMFLFVLLSLFFVVVVVFFWGGDGGDGVFLSFEL